MPPRPGSFVFFQEIPTRSPMARSAAPPHSVHHTVHTLAAPADNIRADRRWMAETAARLSFYFCCLIKHPPAALQRAASPHNRRAVFMVSTAAAHGGAVKERAGKWHLHIFRRPKTQEKHHRTASGAPAGRFSAQQPRGLEGVATRCLCPGGESLARRDGAAIAA